ncbi:transmembrane protein 51b [Megalops cyprinoides]|uniref:transmembrane protein 51b n=1 Tax=Megalops cyprinoides TaxID=118141 RepID=UPI0018652A0D|nr:transmembrane protein 51b [Megalops cyprinoides]XP_036386177.1 transmembrane protein 51b [Megalops cyprinoides]XP_036386178.1 transmembrane protein 51b [Megalops cyprinoides]
MCSSGRLCGGEGRAPPSSASGGSSSGSQYALCALGVGLVALGVVMIVWTVVPADVAGNSSSASSPVGAETDGELDARGKTSSVAFVLVGAGVAMLLLAICLTIRSKHRQRRRESQPQEARYQDQEPAEPGETEEDTAPRYDVPSYEEVVGSGQYPVRQSNLRLSTSQLPSYEDLLQAVENEGEGPGGGTGQDPPQPPPTPAAAAAQPAPEPQSAPPSRSNSRSSRILRPLRVRRIKSEKLHLKDFRLNIRNPAQGGLVTIEPLTPPPQYEDKPPEF